MAKYKYNAFISYSLTADNRLAPDVHSALHRLARPFYALRAVRVFRDKTGLAPSPDLWESIVRALGSSDWFLLFASPLAAQSYWVRQEIDWRLEHRSTDHLIIVLTDGHIAWDRSSRDFDWSVTDALPRSLSGRFKGEPRYVDFTKFHNQQALSLRDNAFREKIIDIGAPLHGKTPEEMHSEDLHRHRQFIRVLCAVVLVIAGLAGLSY